MCAFTIFDDYHVEFPVDLVCELKYFEWVFSPRFITGEQLKAQNCLMFEHIQFMENLHLQIPNLNAPKTATLQLGLPNLAAEDLSGYESNFMINGFSILFNYPPTRQQWRGPVSTVTTGIKKSQLRWIEISRICQHTSSELQSRRVLPTVTCAHSNSSRTRTHPSTVERRRKI